MADLFDGYPLGEVWDEMFSGRTEPRAAYAGLFSSLQPMAGEELAARADLLSQTYRDAGVTFAHAGEEQPFPLDIVPRVIGADEWDVIERGVAQRVLALEEFLADVYGAGQCFTDRILPRSVVTTSADRKSTRLNSSHMSISYAVFCLKKKKRDYFRTLWAVTPLCRTVHETQQWPT